MRSSIELEQGTIHYRDEGQGAPLVFVHGLLVDGRLWRAVTPELSGYRCIVPDWPLGSHTTPLRAGADRSPRGIAHLIADFLEALELEDVTIVANDTGGAISQILASERPQRLAGLVLTNCDCLENFLPPAFRPLQWMAKARLLAFVLLGAHIRAVRSSPLAYGLLTKRRIPAEVLEGWVRPALSNRRIRGDVQYFTRHIDKRLTLDAAARLGAFDRPVLLAWSAEDRFFKIAFAERLAAVFPDARVEPVADAFTFLPEDQPDVLARLIAEFAGSDAVAQRGAA
jgi:pimeloyl-ACP methyl ester carboxylesterase